MARVLALLGLLAGCHRAHEPSALHPGPAKDHPDVVVVVLDTLRADHLTQYGYVRPTSPALRAFASTATRFDDAWALAPWTVPSTATLLTGLSPLRHHQRHNGDVLPAEVDTLAERLRAAGWRTAAFSHNVNVSKKLGFDQGFTDFVTYDGGVLDYPHVGKMVRAVEAWVDDKGDVPYFVYLQPMNCHGPYKVPAAHRSTLLGRPPSGAFRYYQGPMKAILSQGQLAQRAKVTRPYLQSLAEQYDTSVRYELDQVGALFDRLRAEGRYDNALIVLTADHGEELFDHGGFSHGYSLHGEVLHVPLFVKLPGQTTPTAVRSRVTLADLLPTVLDGVGAPAPTTPLDGRSLLPMLHGDALPAQPVLFDVDWKHRCVGHAVLDGQWKLIVLAENYEGLTDVVQLYDVTADPAEAHDVAAEHPDIVARLHAEMDTLVGQAAAGGGVGAPKNVLGSMDQARLEALGYLE